MKETENQKRANALTELLNTAGGSFNLMCEIKSGLERDFDACEDIDFDIVTKTCIDGSRDEVKKAIEGLYDAMERMCSKVEAARDRVKEVKP